MPRPAGWIHGTWPIFPILPSLPPVPPLASSRPTPLFSALQTPVVRRPSRLFRLDRPPLDTTSPSPWAYIADRISLRLWFQPRPARGPWPSRQACLGTRDGSPPTPRKQLPQNKLTSLYLAAPYFGIWDSQAIPRVRPAMASILVELLSTTTTTTTVWRSRFTDDQDAADARAHAPAHALHTTALLN